MDYLISILMTGIGATVVMDLWSMLRKHLLGVPLPNYGMVGRWVGHMPHGRFVHESIARAEAVPGERIIGWITHYLTGIGFAALLIGLFGMEWAERPSLLPALAVGISTVLAPFLLMQPGMGAGIAASRTPNPKAARIQSLITHAVFGLGLYLAGWAAQLLY